MSLYPLSGRVLPRKLYAYTRKRYVLYTTNKLYALLRVASLPRRLLAGALTGMDELLKYIKYIMLD